MSTILKAISAGLSGFWLYLVVAIAAAGAAAWTTHKIDSADYAALQRDHATALADQAKQELVALQAFYDAAALSDRKTLAELTRLNSARTVANKAISTALTTEGTTNAQFAACMALKLPPSVLQHLPQ